VFPVDLIPNGKPGDMGKQGSAEESMVLNMSNAWWEKVHAERRAGEKSRPSRRDLAVDGVPVRAYGRLTLSWVDRLLL
jgi:hypothetical protein